MKMLILLEINRKEEIRYGLNRIPQHSIKEIKLGLNRIRPYEVN